MTKPLTAEEIRDELWSISKQLLFNISEQEMFLIRTRLKQLGSILCEPKLFSSQYKQEPVTRDPSLTEMWNGDKLIADSHGLEKSSPQPKVSAEEVLEETARRLGNKSFERFAHDLPSMGSKEMVSALHIFTGNCMHAYRRLNSQGKNPTKKQIIQVLYESTLKQVEEDGFKMNIVFEAQAEAILKLISSLPNT